MNILWSSLLVLLAISIVFLVIGLIVMGICWAFDITFIWRYVVGVWLILILFRNLK